MKILVFIIPGSRIIKKALRFKGFLQPGREGPESCENYKQKHEKSMISRIPIMEHEKDHEIHENYENPMLKTYDICKLN